MAVASGASPPAYSQTLPGTTMPASTRPATTPEADADRRAVLRQRVEHVVATARWMGDDFIYDRDARVGPNVVETNRLFRSLRDPLPHVGPATTQTTFATATFATRTIVFDLSDPARLVPNWAALQPGPWSPDDLWPLLKDENPKVRTIGLVLLYHLNRADVLADVTTLLKDDAVTFPGSGFISATDFRPDPDDWPLQPRQVKDVAKAILESWARASWELDQMVRFRFPNSKPADIEKELNAFAAKRNSELCTAALRVAMQRASGGTSPTQTDRLDRIRAVLQMIHAVEMPRRFFLLQTVDFDRYSGERYSPSYLLDLARTLPREARLRAMRGERAIDDPDLGDSFRDYFVEHAADLFLVSDADEFARQANAPDAPYYHVAPHAVAAATLVPGKAKAILLPLIDRIPSERFQSGRDDAKRQIAIALALTGDTECLDRAVRWFFDYPPERGHFGTPRSAFLYGVWRRDPRRARDVVERIIRDERLATLGPESSRLLVQYAAGYLGRPIASEAEIRDSYGVDEFQRDRKFASLAQWHERLRQTVDEWSR